MELKDFFIAHDGGALAFSGGTDSALLLWAAATYGKGWRAYYVHTAFQPAFELADARRLAGELGLPLTVIKGDILAHSAVAANPADRCYHCKRVLFSLILERAAADGCTLVIDGSNASDDEGDRPGMRALRELSVDSPLRACGLTKAAVRRMSQQAGLFTWNKPAYACLATRIPTGTALTLDALRRVEQGETLLAARGYSDFRLRLHGDMALLQLTAEQLPRALEERELLQGQLAPLFGQVSVDRKPRPSSVGKEGNHGQ